MKVFIFGVVCYFFVFVSFRLSHGVVCQVERNTYSPPPKCLLFGWGIGLLMSIEGLRKKRSDPSLLGGRTLKTTQTPS